MSYVLQRRLPAADEHKALMRAVGWDDHIDDRVLKSSLNGSLCGAVVVLSGNVVGMARLAGDGAHYFYVQDVVVHPQHSGSGLGPRLLAALLEWVDELGVPDPFVGLFSSPEAEDMYRDAGFTTADMTGMHR